MPRWLSFVVISMVLFTTASKVFATGMVADSQASNSSWVIGSPVKGVDDVLTDSAKAFSLDHLSGIAMVTAMSPTNVKSWKLSGASTQGRFLTGTLGPGDVVTTSFEVGSITTSGQFYSIGWSAANEANLTTTNAISVEFLNTGTTRDIDGTGTHVLGTWTPGLFKAKVAIAAGDFYTLTLTKPDNSVLTLTSQWGAIPNYMEFGSNSGSAGMYVSAIQVNAPEPSSVVMLGVVAFGLLARRRRPAL